MEKNTVFEEVSKNVIESTNYNFHFDRLEWSTKVWLKEMCAVIEKRLKDIEMNINMK